MISTMKGMARRTLSDSVIGCAIEVHRLLGPGLLETTYEACLAHELGVGGVPYESQAALPVKYKSVQINCAYRIDLLVAGELLLELKSVDQLLPIHQAQILTCLKLAKLPQGLSINFNVPLLKNGIKSFLN